MAESKNRRKSHNPAPINPNDHPGKSLGFGQDRGRKVTRDADRAAQQGVSDAYADAATAT
jgi:hypothetical protein